MGGLDGVMMTDELGTFIQNRLEEVGSELQLACFPNILRNFPPHVSDEDDVPESLVSTKLAKHFEIARSNPTEPLVGKAADVDNSCER